MQRLEVSGAVWHIYVIRRLKVKSLIPCMVDMSDCYVFYSTGKPLKILKDEMSLSGLHNTSRQEVATDMLVHGIHILSWRDILIAENVTFYSFYKCKLHTDCTETMPNYFTAAFRRGVLYTICHSSMFVEMKVVTYFK